MIIDLPKNVENIIGSLEEHGFEGFAVGGCVRDSLLKKTPKDWDITTDALPVDMKKIFKKTFDTGIAHGTVTVLMDGVGYELTTYRIDGNYSDGRHPDSVSFSKSLSEDLCRRDFTINAMAYSHKKGIVDLFDGRKDLQNGIIRAVGDAKKRFDEDALRMLRAVRFAAQLGFKIDDDTFEAIKEKAKLLSNVSKERIFVELNKSLNGEFAQNIKMVYTSGLYRYIGKEFAKLNKNIYDFYPRKFPNKKHMYWAAFLENIENAEAVKKILFELKSDNATRNNTYLLVKELKNPLPSSDEDIRWSLHRIGADLFCDYIEILKSDKKNVDILDKIDTIENRYSLILKENHAYEISMLDITGKDLMDIGISKGPKIGEVLEFLLKKVIENPLNNEKSSLLRLAKEFI
ncbi:tRNA nucleotidyltransferase/poly(A) polymerase family protein [Lachnospiraceae bacterium oral taxon 082 str. F0431]|nr:tRNA nucleotidyltransferase/poly(A) polymerase family protein [Lachnospiraceae bacterium oral taxon 082 str. F0431]